MNSSKHGVMMQFFEWYLPCDHSLWQRLIDGEAAALAGTGFTGLWLPPATKGAFGDQGVGYAVYDKYDLGEFDQKGSVPTKYGTKQQYVKAVAAAKKAGLDVYADIVLNHMIGADDYEELSATEYAGNNRTLPVSGEETIKAWTVFNFPGRKGKYSDFIWDSSCFDGVDWDDSRKKGAVYLLKGHGWQSDVDTENGNYDYLMGADIDFDQQKVIDELTTWGKWYVKTTGITGFRLDAVKHIKADFYRDWLPTMREAMGKPDAFAVGEYWNPDVNALKNYLHEVNGTMSLFDVPLHMNFYHISCDGAGSDLRKVFDGSLVQTDPTHSVPFVDNHDTQPGQALSSFVGTWFKPHAYSLFLLREEGYPCVFYGDYYGIPHDNIAPHKELIDTLLNIRHTKMTGARHDYFYDAHGIGWTNEGGFAVVLSTKYDQQVQMYVGTQYAGKVFVDALGNRPEEVTIAPDGNGTFFAKDGFTSVWVEKQGCQNLKTA